MSRFTSSAITFLIGSLMLIGLPIVAWGLSDFPSFIDHPARLGYIVFVLVANAVAAVRIPEVGKTRDTPRTSVSRQHLTVLLLQGSSIAIVLVAPFCDRRSIFVMEHQESVRFFGLGMYVCGFLAMHLAESRLGKLFSTEVAVQVGHHLVTDGMYRYLRHPRYLGIMAFTAGIALVFRSWVGIALSAATVLVLLWRIHDEELLMRQEFGQAWETYCRRSWRLVPFVY